MKRVKLVAGNWKMNKDFEQGMGLVSEIVNMVKDEVHNTVEIAICTPFIHLASAAKLVKGEPKIGIGAQNCYVEKSGAYTGEISAAMIASTGAKYVIIGHSERREYFAESNEMLKKKTLIALENGLTPIFCCGESLEMRQGGDFLGFVKNQLTESLWDLTDEQFSKIVIAYEPIWAIGTGLTASSAQAQEMHFELRKHLAGKFGQAAADQCRILYGGSAKPSNAAELFSCPDVDGGLIGGASLVSRDFLDIIACA